jgi:hypothetical protein
MPSDLESLDVEHVIHDMIGWALKKDLGRLLSIVVQDGDLFIFHPDSKSTIIGFEAFRQLAQSVWMSSAFRATDYAIRDLQIHFAELRNVAWYSCFLDDHAEWNGKVGGWDNCRWTGLLEKRNGSWLIVQMHFSFAQDS